MDFSLFKIVVDLDKLRDLERKVDLLMSKISEFAAKMDAHNAKVDAAVDGLVADVAGLKDEITKLQNTSGVITPEDQALLDGIEARGAAISEKLAALDALTPPVAPPG